MLTGRNNISKDTWKDLEVSVYGVSRAEVLIEVSNYGVSKTEEFTKIFYECQGSKIFVMSN